MKGNVATYLIIFLLNRHNISQLAQVLHNLIKPTLNNFWTSCLTQTSTYDLKFLKAYFTGLVPYLISKLMHDQLWINSSHFRIGSCKNILYYFDRSRNNSLQTVDRLTVIELLFLLQWGSPQLVIRLNLSNNLVIALFRICISYYNFFISS